MATITEEPELIEQQLDSGMGSSDARSPEVKCLLPEEDEADEEDETVLERLVGLTEMFPDGVRNFSCRAAGFMKNFVKGFYSFSCNTTWIFFSSSAILIAPLIFEIERAQMEEAQRLQQKQVLFGPNTPMPGGDAGGFPMPPPIQR
ncbi:mitochondrial import receptor subunit TOM22 homolog [Copidosoma floridanum]|uniref:mitochondrial import receptor subunit TOM22 homolog n=1 Tax=Copidosoma floridanum TaxID=29053 RepID=UPI0006C960BF|nr:mitochondrial import receptor subunit TOM22 homolog [Copidosoma floridanum]